MKISLFAIIGSVVVSMANIPSVAAYSSQAHGGSVSNFLIGEHPYETRKRDERFRKRLAERERTHIDYRFEDIRRFHPLYAKKSVLHPFYRKGGRARIEDRRFSRWRGYLDPQKAYEFSPEIRCSNYTYLRSVYRGEPLGYDCF